jgi:hypothetical protein
MKTILVSCSVAMTLCALPARDAHAQTTVEWVAAVLSDTELGDPSVLLGGNEDSGLHLIVPIAMNKGLRSAVAAQDPGVVGVDAALVGQEQALLRGIEKEDIKRGVLLALQQTVAHELAHVVQHRQGPVLAAFAGTGPIAPEVLLFADGIIALVPQASVPGQAGSTAGRYLVFDMESTASLVKGEGLTLVDTGSYTSSSRVLERNADEGGLVTWTGRSSVVRFSADASLTPAVNR